MTVNVEKMRHQVRRAEAHALLGTRVHVGPWTSTAVEGPLAAINRETQRLAIEAGFPVSPWAKVAEREAAYEPAWRAALEAAGELD